MQNIINDNNNSVTDEITENNLEDLNLDSKDKVQPEVSITRKDKSFLVVMLSELGACFSITFWLLILASLFIKGYPLVYWITFGFTKTSGGVIENVMIAFWVFLDVLFTIIVFERWSCNANPAVSLFIYLVKDDTGKNTAFKILFQYIGATIAGAIAMLLVNVTMPSHLTSQPDPSNFTGFNNNAVFGFGGLGTSLHFVTGSLSIVIVEALAAAGLCWSLLSKNINKNVSIISVLIFLFIAPAAAQPTGVLSFNAARAFGPIIFHDIQLVFIWHQHLTIYNSEMLSYIFFVLGPIIGVYTYYLFSRIFDEKIVNAWLKFIGQHQHKK